jgi:hypothetical protein
VLRHQQHKPEMSLLKESFLNQVVGAAITKTLRNITNGVKQTIKKPHCYAAYYNKELV